MARYTGPRVRISRRFNEPILGDNKALQKKNYAPGQHGRGKKRKQSEYATQLNEKQKAKYIYGLLERQFAKTFNEASRKKGKTGEVLLQLLEAGSTTQYTVSESLRHADLRVSLYCISTFR
jgi:small subunit ribosomal protein S4